MSLFAPPPEPKSLLGFHRVLSPSAGVRVSPLCLGAMNFGDAWEALMGKCDKKNTFEMLDFFYENGGNFIDTANNYQNEESETWIGDWMKERGNRDEMVIATKFTTMYRGGGHEKIKANFQGQTHKSLRLSLEASLKKMQTSYIDVLYIHWWDFTTSIPEVMQSLASVVREGKVLYLGISDTPAWIVSKANQYARDHALPQFVVYQGQWSAAMRDFEREIIPMCREEGMALAPWGALGGGNFKTEEQRKTDEGRKFGPPSENHLKISKVLEGIANKRKTIITSVALAYVMHKAPYVFPIVGGRNTKHLQGNIDALGLGLSTEELDEIDDATNFDLGFPMNMLFSFMGQKYNSRMTSKDIPLLKNAVFLDTPEHQQPIKPHSLDATDAADR